MIWGTLLLASSVPLPTADEVKSAVPEYSSTCVMFLSGVCICSQFVAETVQSIECVEGEALGEVTCGYNVLFTDIGGLEGKHREQRTDVFQIENGGGWTWTRSISEPILFDSFDVPRSPFAKRSEHRNPRRSLRR